MIILGFFFLLHPGKYAHMDNDKASPFRFCDTHLLINDRRIQHYTAADTELAIVNYVTLEFTNQKNGVRGELVGLGHSSHPTYCPVRALINRTKHLRSHNTPRTTPLYSFFHHGWQDIDTTILTNHLRHTITAMGQHYGIQPTEVSF